MSPVVILDITTHVEGRDPCRASTLGGCQRVLLPATLHLHHTYRARLNLLRHAQCSTRGQLASISASEHLVPPLSRTPKSSSSTGFDPYRSHPTALHTLPQHNLAQPNLAQRPTPSSNQQPTTRITPSPAPPPLNLAPPTPSPTCPTTKHHFDRNVSLPASPSHRPTQPTRRSTLTGL